MRYFLIILIIAFLILFVTNLLVLPTAQFINSLLKPKALKTKQKPINSKILYKDEEITIFKGESKNKTKTDKHNNV